ncbi:GNAT family N-acetyltransferase [Kingella negevensis]|uniref:GNAT family N-acetyltransferase n=1 Tax=Kingella negevensis TaxID=1522312 RepID=UPI00254BB829|nr:GNAT family N-acetyltransferase [Kingella negevensis]MDK4688976.1 GNAT family N-acetyltransferase [Kingella negevensis]
MNICHATLNDLHTLAQIEAAYLQGIETRLQHFAYHFWLLEDNGAIVAFINGSVCNERDLVDEMYHYPEMHNPNADWQMISSVVTAPQHRSKGYAGKLLERVIEDNRAQNRKGVVLTCKERLLGFYGKFGFQDEGVSESTYGNTVWHQMRLTY